MDIKEFIKNLENTIEDVEANTISEELDFQNDLEQWDSMAALTVLAMIDTEYEVVLNGEDLTKCKNVKDLFDTICKKKNQ